MNGRGVSGYSSRVTRVQQVNHFSLWTHLVVYQVINRRVPVWWIKSCELEILGSNSEKVFCLIRRCGHINRINKTKGLPTANKCPKTIESPMARDLDPMSERLGSKFAKTVKTTIKVVINSTPKACPSPMCGCSLVTPSEPCTSRGVTPYNIPAPTIPPINCAKL